MPKEPPPLTDKSWGTIDLTKEQREQIEQEELQQDHRNRDKDGNPVIVEDRPIDL